MNCLEIVKKYLTENGFDGLHSGSDCGCELSDLAPCSFFPLRCTPGYKLVPPASSNCRHDSYICDSKDDRPWEYE